MIKEIVDGAGFAISSSQRTHRMTPLVELHEVLGPSTTRDSKILGLLESAEPTGSQKDCGASWATESFSPGSGKVLVARSSGNHATAMARCAQLRGLVFKAIVPHDTSEVKKLKIQNYGAELHLCEPTLSSKFAKLKEVIEATNGTEIHSSYHPLVIQGQGAIAFKLLDQIPPHEELTVVIPSSGAGTATGIASVIKELRPKAKVVIAEPEGADDFSQSLTNNRQTPFNYEPHSIAHGLLTPISDIAFEVCITKGRADHICTLSEQEIINATLWLWEQGLRIETSAAVALAAIQNRKFPIKGTICAVLTGGNISDEEIKDLYLIRNNFAHSA